MKALRQFTIPILGLAPGTHQYQFKIEDDFFSNFEESPIKHGKFDLNFILDKREDMLILTFDFKGSKKTECDRCLATIDLPFSGDEDLIVKYASEADEEDEVVYIEKGVTELNVAKYIYEYICLSMPFVNIYDCENEEENVCDLKMLDYLDKKSDIEAASKEEEKGSSPFDDLKKNFNKN